MSGGRSPRERLLREKPTRLSRLATTRFLPQETLPPIAAPLMRTPSHEPNRGSHQVPLRGFGDQVGVGEFVLAGEPQIVHFPEFALGCSGRRSFMRRKGIGICGSGGMLKRDSDVATDRADPFKPLANRE
jgi:hypothetical protein